MTPGPLDAPPYALLADLMLALHVAVVAFVVGHPLAVMFSRRRHWSWAGRLDVRLLHAAVLALVVVQAWLGQPCVLTLWESALRERSGGVAYAGSFIGEWLQRLLYVDAPLWALALAYTAFAALVGWTWWRVPPQRPAHRGSA